MKKLILLSLLLFGCLTNYAQIYKVTFHKPDNPKKNGESKKKVDDESNFVYTLFTANKKYEYKEQRALSDVSDSIIYITEEPKALNYHSWQRIYSGPWWWWSYHSHSIDWEKEFINSNVSGYGCAWDHGTIIVDCDIMVTYERLYCECSDATTAFCKDDVPQLTFTNTFGVPYQANIYIASTKEPDKQYELNIIVEKGATSFSVQTIDIFNLIGYNEAFDIFVKFYKRILGTKLTISTYKIHFDGLKQPILFEKPYILDDHLIIPNIDTGINSKCNFILSGKTISQDVNPSKQLIPTGQYQLQISDKNEEYCQVNLDAYVPFIEYKFLDGDTHTHWHSEDTIQAINLKIYNVDNESLKDYITITDTYPQNSNHFFKCKPDNTTIEEELTYYKEHIKTDSTIPLYATPYKITCHPDLQRITITPTDERHTIPTIITTNNKLKDYPPIHVKVTPIPADCFYNMHKVKIDSISGGLSNGYNYTIIGNNSETEIHQGDTIVIPNNNQKEFSYKLAFYDASISTEDSKHGGKKARSFTTNETHVTMPDTLGVDKYEITDVACHGDATGKIQILSLKYADTNRPISYLWNTNSTQNFIDNLPIGLYTLTLSDGVCTVNSEYKIKQPQKLIFKSYDIKNASCFGYNDGEIKIIPDGGIKPYTYWINDSIVSYNITKLFADDYHIKVVDSNNCIIERDTKISEPTKVENNFIAHDYSICQDSELEIDAGDFADYEWKDPQGKTLKAKSILTLNNASPEGKYYLKTIREDKCFAEDFINITQSKESLKMNFLLPSDIYNDDYAKIVETSSHELDSLKWSFSENLIGDFPKDSTTLTISTNALDKLSTYKIKLTGYYKGCISTVTKNLNISNQTRPEEEYIPDFYDSDEILDCRIGPNPNNGNFTLFLDLDCAKDAVLTIYSINSYKYVLREKLVGLQNYEHSINQNLQQGLYILEVKTPKSIRRIKFEVTR